LVKAAAALEAEGELAVTAGTVDGKAAVAVLGLELVMVAAEEPL
jgi:hypothetical protein